MMCYYLNVHFQGQRVKSSKKLGDEICILKIKIAYIYSVNYAYM